MAVSFTCSFLPLEDGAIESLTSQRSIVADALAILREQALDASFSYRITRLSGLSTQALEGWRVPARADVEVLGDEGTKTVLRTGWHEVQHLAWHGWRRRTDCYAGCRSPECEIQ